MHLRPARPGDEVRRLATLRSLGLLDTSPEERFDRITRLAQRLFDVPIALVSLVDEDRQWFKSRQGLAVAETPRSMSFCAHAIADNGVLHVPDAAADARFADNPLVLGDPRIRFYAGCPIAAPDGSKLGTLCVIGPEPRQLSDADAVLLAELAEMVEREVAMVQLAFADELTGLRNRRGFLLLAEPVLEVCEREDAPAALAYIDVDGLKAINDRLGHEAGDRLIRSAAALLQSTFRSTDVLGRLGGDEFCALLTGTESPEVAVERLRAALRERNAQCPSSCHLSLSIGLAKFDPKRPDPIAELLRRADESMYVAKARGVGARGRVTEPTVTA